MKRWIQVVVLTILIACIANIGVLNYEIQGLQSEITALGNVSEANNQYLYTKIVSLYEGTVSMEEEIRGMLGTLREQSQAGDDFLLDLLCTIMGDLKEADVSMEEQLIAVRKHLKSHINAVGNVVNRWMGSTVNVHIKYKEINYGTGEQKEYVAAGVVISESGIILTAGHVVDDVFEQGTLDRMWVEFEDGTQLDVVGVAHTANRDPDVGVMWVDPNGYKLTAVPMDSGIRETLQKGESVVVIGNPWNFGHSVEVGVIADPNQDATDCGGVPGNFLQLSAHITGGNSGGPVFDLDGNLLGIVSWGGVGVGIQFLVPTDIILEGLSQCRTMEVLHASQS